MRKVTFWKFVKHPITTTLEQADMLAKRIESGEITPMYQHGERFYKLGGWCYDVGRMPYLVEYEHGHIQRQWAMSVAELRKACHLSRNEKVILDPFYNNEVSLISKAA